MWARVGAAGAERAEGRSGARSGAGSPPGGAERSRVLDEAEKSVTAPAWVKPKARQCQESARESGLPDPNDTPEATSLVLAQWTYAGRSRTMT
ncbi:hypothetical protein GCM10010254_04250 [Streptomyces chromofuscus]|nr:hypothetical protein GCM10010254_04250 [Streptomyces chromofuscus]